MDIPLDATAVNLIDQLTDSHLDNITTTSLELDLNVILNTGTLHFLTHALPDPNLELFYQHHFLTEFHLFPKLPIELRFRIWNLVRARQIIARFNINFCLRSKTAAPVTFRINHESRIETMRHYEKPYRLDNYHPNKSQRALHQHWFDPKADSVYIQHHFLGSFKWLHRSRHESPTPGKPSFHTENLASIESLEVDEFYCHSIGWSSWDEVYLRDSDKDQVRFKESIFSAFTELKELTLRGGGSGGLRKFGDIKDCISTLTRCYEKLRSDGIEKKELCTAPRVRVRMPCHKMGEDLESCEKCRGASRHRVN